MNDKICPICKEANGCMSGSKNCWCYTIKVPKGLLESLPAEKRGRACICKKCIEKFNKKNNL